MGKFVMPSLGADMEAGTLVEWLKKPGDEVKRGDIIAVVDTQKGAIEIEVFEDGILASYLADLGTKVPVGSPLALIKGAGDGDVPVEVEQTPEALQKPDAGKTPPPASVVEPVVTSPPPASSQTVVGQTGRIKVTPAARRLAQKTGVDLTEISGTGPGGVIEILDVAAAKPAKDQAATVAGSGAACPDMSAMREAIAAAMARSKREIPHYYLSTTCGLAKAEAFVSDYNAGRPPEERLLLAALFIKSVALSMSKYPEFNGHYEEGIYQPSKPVHAGFAINIRGGGLVAPAIHNADTLDLAHLMEKMRDLVARVRAGRFRAAELSDPTITISSLGERGVEALYGVIYPPQVAILGFGKPVGRPQMQDDALVERPCVTVTLAADHRVSDGHRGALFLNAIDKHLQKPEAL